MDTYSYIDTQIHTYLYKYIETYVHKKYVHIYWLLGAHKFRHCQPPGGAAMKGFGAGAPPAVGAAAGGAAPSPKAGATGGAPKPGKKSRIST